MTPAPREQVETTEEEVRWFRARRSHLAGPGAASPVAAARAILGAQAQQEAPALLALSLRTRGRPTAAAVKSLLAAEGERALVRTWGQRDTLHIYDPSDWGLVTAARSEWPKSGRRGLMPSDDLLALARTRFERATSPLLRSHLFDIIPPAYLDEVAAHPGAGKSPIRLAASRLVWRLAMSGEICMAHKEGAEQLYAPRRLWFPDLDWSALPAPEAAARVLARRYLAVHGPATPTDIAHFFGAKVSSVKVWLGPFRHQLVGVSCGSRKGLLALAEDADAVRRPPPAAADWPLRLLPQWDTHLMRHKDKSWLLARGEEAPKVWAKAANVLPTVLARGRIVATWSHKTARRRVVVTVRPLGGWRAQYLPRVRREAAALAAHLEVAGSEVGLAAD